MQFSWAELVNYDLPLDEEMHSSYRYSEERIYTESA